MVLISINRIGEVETFQETFLSGIGKDGAHPHSLQSIPQTDEYDSAVASETLFYRSVTYQSLSVER